jgi:hypothetical protein
MASTATYMLSADGVVLTYATTAHTLDLTLRQPISFHPHTWQLTAEALRVSEPDEYGFEVAVSVALEVEPHVEITHRLTIYLPAVAGPPDIPGARTADGLLVIASIGGHRFDERRLPAPTFTALNLTGTVSVPLAADVGVPGGR